MRKIHSRVIVSVVLFFFSFSLFAQAPKADMTSDKLFGDSPLTINFTSKSANASALLWEFGNGNTSNLENPSNVYFKSGQYTVKLIAKGIGGEKDSIVAVNMITVHPSPVADFDCNESSECVGSSLMFKNQSENATSFLWDFGDGITSMQDNPIHVYDIPGLYTIKLVAYSSDGKSHIKVKEKSLEIFPEVTLRFEVDSQIGCNLENRFLFNTEFQGASFIEWDFGDGHTSNVKKPIHNYQKEGQYSVALTVVDSNGCSITERKEDYIALSEYKPASFLYDSTVFCQGVPIQFHNTSVKGIKWHWDFGDSLFSLAENPSHTFKKTGDFQVKLTAIDQHGCEHVSTHQTSIPIASNSTANFSQVISTGCAPSEVSFLNGSKDAVSCFWEFGDGTTSSSPNPMHTYLNNGTYQVKLHVKNSGGCLASASSNVALNPVLADFKADQSSSCAPVLKMFHDISVNGTNCLWDFGDGHVSNERNPTHNYELPGSYSVSLISFNQDGCTDTVTRVDYIKVENMVAGFISPPTVQVCVPFDAKFDGRIGGATSWAWEFGDGTTSNSKTPSHRYKENGLYHVSLTITLKDGCLQHYPSFRSFEVKGGAPLDVILSKSSCPDYFLSITNLCSRKPVSCQWDFGDGSVGYEYSPVHEYSKSGHYPITYAATDSFGCRQELVLSDGVLFNECDSSQTRLEVVDPGIPAKAGGFLNPDTMITSTHSTSKVEKCSPFFVGFQNMFEGTVSWIWSFGDGDSSILENPVHQYLNEGRFDVSLITVDTNGTKSAFLWEDYVVAHEGKASFKMEETSNCSGTKFIFTDESPGAASWSWDFGDGYISQEANPIHAYHDTAKSFVVKLTTTDLNGCVNSLQSSVLIAQDTPTVWMDNHFVCGGETAQFYCSSSSYEHYLWDFGDGSTSAEQNPFYQYKNGGSYQVRLTVTGTDGCQQQLMIPHLIVVHNPLADFDFTVGEGCQSQVVTLKNTSTNISLPLSSHCQWEFDDGSEPVFAKDLSHDYSKSGSYDIKLTVHHDSACFHSVTKKVVVEPKHTALFSVGEHGDCLPITVQYFDQSDHAVSWFWEFGDGSTSSDQHPIHVFNEFPEKEIKLTITTEDSCVMSVTQKNIKPFRSEFELSQSVGCVPFEVSFRNVSNRSTSCRWDFGDGHTSDLINPSHLYEQQGDYLVQLAVSNEFGCHDTSYFKYVSANLPQANFVVEDAEGCAPFKISFKDSSLNSNEWFWDFGDGTTSQSQDPEHIYHLPGLYSVSLSSQNGNCRDSIVKDTLIHVLGGVAEFEVKEDTLCAESEITIINLSREVSTLEWNFGDGSSFYGSEPRHRYSAGGEYTISLKAENKNGCISYFRNPIPIVIASKPQALFEVASSSVCVDQNFTLSNNSVDANQYLWSFGDGTFLQDFEPIKSYADAGVRELYLAAHNDFGCSDTSEVLLVSAHLNPTAEFEYSVSCPAYTTSLKSNSSFQEDAHYKWYVDDLFISDEYSPLIRFNEIKKKVVTFEIENKHGCSDSVRKDVEVFRPGYQYLSDAGLLSVSVESDSAVTAKWQVSKSNNFKYYVLYRKLPGRAGYLPIAKVKDRMVTSFIDKGLHTDGSSFCYKLRVFDDCERALELDAVVAHCTINVQTEVSGTYVKVGWSPYLGALPESYSVYRNYGGENQLIRTVSNHELEFIDTSFQCSGLVSYLIKANQLNGIALYSLGNTSNSIVYNLDTNDLQVEMVRSTVVNNDSVFTEWKPPSISQEKILGYLVYRSFNGTDFNLIAELGPLVTDYMDHEVEVEADYHHYKVKVMEGCHTPHLIKNISSSILLSVELEDERSFLEWTPYAGWKDGVDYYIIEKQNSQGVWEEVKEVREEVLHHELE